MAWRSDWLVEPVRDASIEEFGYVKCRGTMWVEGREFEECGV